MNLTIHGNIKPNKCTYCEYETSQSQYIRNHILVVHEREKPCKIKYSSLCNYPRYAFEPRDLRSYCLQWFHCVFDCVVLVSVNIYQINATKKEKNDWNVHQNKQKREQITLSLFYKQRSKKETSRCLFQIIQKRLVVA